MVIPMRKVCRLPRECAASRYVIVWEKSFRKKASLFYIYDDLVVVLAHLSFCK